ncbi:MAG: hypothetical protein MZV65_53205 [Chromatiales bacterium]|nr:hypothetical protein [Chromatiales bacterium]
MPVVARHAPRAPRPDTARNGAWSAEHPSELRAAGRPPPRPHRGRARAARRRPSGRSSWWPTRHHCSRARAGSARMWRSSTSRWRGTADLAWLRALRQRCPEVKVVVLSVHDEQSVRRAAMDAGADAFVLKRAIATDLLDAVDRVRKERTCDSTGPGLITWRAAADSDRENGICETASDHRLHGPAGHW